jgi:hypothetical protein
MHETRSAPGTAATLLLKAFLSPPHQDRTDLDQRKEMEMPTSTTQPGSRRTRRGLPLRRVLTAVSALAVLTAAGAPAAHAQSPNASCVAHITRGPVGPPGGAQSQIHFDRFGHIVRHVAKAEGRSFEECLPALLEALGE